MIWLLKQLRLDERSTHVVHACRAHVVRVRLVCKALLVGLLLSVGGAAHRGAHGTGAFTHGHGGRHCASDDTPPVNASDCGPDVAVAGDFNWTHQGCSWRQLAPAANEAACEAICISEGARLCLLGDIAGASVCFGYTEQCHGDCQNSPDPDSPYTRWRSCLRPEAAGPVAVGPTDGRADGALGPAEVGVDAPGAPGPAADRGVLGGAGNATGGPAPAASPGGVVEPTSLPCPRFANAPAEDASVCGPDTAQRGENSFTVSCTYTPSGIVETAAECDAICTAAGATHCSFGWFNGSSCFAFTATCPGDCVLADNRAMISWQTCREAGDPVTPRVCAAEEPGGGGVQECGPATAAPGDFSWAITGCRWAELGNLETTEECEAACVAAQARLCVFGEYALGNCFAYFEDCPGDCSLRLSEDTVFQRWATCYQVPQGGNITAVNGSAVDGTAAPAPADAFPIPQSVSVKTPITARTNASQADAAAAGTPPARCPDADAAAADLPEDCGPSSAVIGNWAVSAGCSWFGEEASTPAACEAMCVAAGATHCQWGLLAPTRRSCLAHFEACPGDCQLLPDSNGTQTDNLVWRSCYRRGDPVKPRVCPGKEDVLAVPLKRCGPSTAEVSDLRWAHAGCSWRHVGTFPSAEECDEACLAAEAYLCVYGLFAGGDCAAYAEECLGDCVGASMPDRMSSYQRWATCRVGPGRAESAGGDGGAPIAGRNSTATGTLPSGGASPPQAEGTPGAPTPGTAVDRDTDAPTTSTQVAADPGNSTDPEAADILASGAATLLHAWSSAWHTHLAVTGAAVLAASIWC